MAGEHEASGEVESVERLGCVPVVFALVVCFVDACGFPCVVDEVGSEEACEAVGEGFFGVYAPDLPRGIVDDGEGERAVLMGFDGGGIGVKVDEVGEFADVATEEPYELDEVEFEGFLGFGVFGGGEVIEVLCNIFDNEFAFGVRHEVAVPFPGGCLWCGYALQQAGGGAVLVAGLPKYVTLRGLALEEYLFELIHLVCVVG